MIRSSMELVWSNPPTFNFGFYVAHNKWRIYIMRRVGQELKVCCLFSCKAETVLDRLLVGTICCRLADYTLQELRSMVVKTERERQDILAQIKFRAAQVRTDKKSEDRKEDDEDKEIRRSNNNNNNSGTFKQQAQYHSLCLDKVS